MGQLIAQGSVGNLSTLANYENQFKEGERGQVVLGLRAPVPQVVIDAISSGLTRAGVVLDGKITQITGSSAELYIPFRKAIAPLAIIAAIIIGIVVLFILITFWKLFKEVGINPWVGMGLLIAVVAIAAFWLLAEGKVKVPTVIGVGG